MIVMKIFIKISLDHYFVASIRAESNDIIWCSYHYQVVLSWNGEGDVPVCSPNSVIHSSGYVEDEHKIALMSDISLEVVC